MPKLSQVCTETITHFLQMGGDHAEPNHIRLMLGCAEICQTSANFMLRVSDLHNRTWGCAEVSERCAEDCQRFGDDQMMQQYVQDLVISVYHVSGGPWVRARISSRSALTSLRRAASSSDPAISASPLSASRPTKNVASVAVT